MLYMLQVLQHIDTVYPEFGIYIPFIFAGEILCKIFTIFSLFAHVWLQLKENKRIDKRSIKVSSN